MFERIKNFLKRQPNEMQVYAFDNYEGDKGIIIAKTRQKAIKIYKKRYSNVVVDTYDDYYAMGMCILLSLGELQNNTMYVNAEC